jgi:hypothetical protein
MPTGNALATRALILKSAPTNLNKRTTAMPRFARIFLIAFAAIATSCSSERPQKEAESKEIGRQLTATYYSCVRTSFASQLPTMVDRNMAMDQAFMVCQTEEAKLQAFEKYFNRKPECRQCGHVRSPQQAERGTLAPIVPISQSKIQKARYLPHPALAP